MPDLTETLCLKELKSNFPNVPEQELLRRIRECRKKHDTAKAIVACVSVKLRPKPEPGLNPPGF